MKYISTKSSESSKGFYGKKGMVLCGFMMVFFCPTQQRVVTHYIDVVVDVPNAKTDAATSVAVLEAVLSHVRENYSHLHQVVLNSDNGPHFASYEYLASIAVLNEKIAKKHPGRNFYVSEYLFSEPQTGKGRLDCHFGMIKTLLKDRIKGHLQDIVRPKDLYQGLTGDLEDGSGVVSGTTTAILTPPESTPEQRLAKGGKSAKDVLAKVATVGIQSVVDVSFVRHSLNFTVRTMSGMPGVSSCTFDFSKAPLAKWLGKYGHEYLQCQASTTFTAHQTSPRTPKRWLRPAPKQQTKVPQTATAQQFANAVLEWQQEVTAKKDAADAAEKAATLPVHAILESVSGTALADHLKGERSDDEAVSDGSDGENDAALVASTVWDPLCGLKSGYGRRCRRNNPKMDRAVKHQLMAMFSQGDITGSRMTPEGAFEELCKIGVVTNNWSARLVVTPDKIKAFFSAMAQKEKAAKKRKKRGRPPKQAAAAAAAGAGESPATVASPEKKSPKKKKRGRPKKAAAVIEPSPNKKSKKSAAAVTGGAAKKRGRSMAGAGVGVGDSPSKKLKKRLDLDMAP